MDKMKVFFLRNSNGHPVATVASTLLSDGVVKYAVATRNPLDNFDKEHGRALAIGRLFDGKTPFVGATSGTTEGVKKRIMVGIANDRKFPQRAREAAGVWLEADKKRQPTTPTTA